MRDFWFLDDARAYGGGQRNVLRLARFISSSGTARTARVLCPGDSELAKRCRATGLQVVEVRFPDLELLRAVRGARAVGALRHVLRAAGRDTVIVGFSLRTQVYAHTAALGLPASRQIVHFMVEQDSARRLSAQLLLRRYGAVVAVGDNAGRIYRELCRGASVRTVNNFLLPNEMSDAAAKAGPMPSIQPPALGVLARLIPEKGVVELVAELANAPGAWSRLVVAGAREDEGYARAVEECVSALGLDDRVRLLGNIEDLAAFFAEVHALVVPSVGKEGQPTVIIEALAHGRPAIVRAPIWSEDFRGLPVFPYGSASELERLLPGLDREPAFRREELERRFGPMQAVAALEQAAADSKAVLT
jgi:glycosyltransferase involved in cell wall biosynthesis